MTQIVWAAPGSKVIQTGLDRGVLYLGSSEGVPWNGLVNLTENVSGGEQESFYYDGVKYLDVISYEDYQATLEAFAAPDEFGPCDGNQQVALGLYATNQRRLPFSLAYRTQIGNDLEEEAGYKVHLVYNCVAAPSERVWSTKSNETQAPTLSWTLYGRPPKPGTYSGLTYKPTAHLILDSRKANAARLEVLENVLYGMPAGGTPVAPYPDGLAHLPTQVQIVNFMNTGFW